MTTATLERAVILQQSTDLTTDFIPTWFTKLNHTDGMTVAAVAYVCELSVDKMADGNSNLPDKKLAAKSECKLTSDNYRAAMPRYMPSNVQHIRWNILGQYQDKTWQSWAVGYIQKLLTPAYQLEVVNQGLEVKQLQ